MPHITDQHSNTLNAECATADTSRAIAYLTSAVHAQLIAVRPAPTWTLEDGTSQEPQTLIIAHFPRVTTNTELNHQLKALTLYCDLFAQDSIAVCLGFQANTLAPHGVLLGRNPQGLSFDPEYFNFK